MIEALINDPTIFDITIVLLVLLSIALWQKLKQFAAILGMIYFIYIIFIISSYENNPEPEIIKKSITDDIDNRDDIMVTNNNQRVKEDTSMMIADVAKDDKPIKKLNLKPKEILNDDQPINVLNIRFGTGIVNRQIENESRTFTTETNRIYCLSGIQNRKTDTKIFHKWYYEGELKSKILLNVGKSFNWRTWSYINVYENRIGDWQVVVEDTLGIRHDSLSFSITSSN